MSDFEEQEKRQKKTFWIIVVLVIVASLGVVFGLMGGEWGIINQGLCGFLLAMGLIALIGAIVVVFWQEKGVVEKNTYITAGICVLVAILIGVAVGAGACSGEWEHDELLPSERCAFSGCSQKVTRGKYCSYHAKLIYDYGLEDD